MRKLVGRICEGLKNKDAIGAVVRMRYLNAFLGALLHSILIIVAYIPPCVRCMEFGIEISYPVMILFWLLSLNEMLLSITPPSVMVLPVCSFMFSIILGLFISQFFPWIYPFLILGLLIFLLGLLLQFLITLL